MGCKRNRNDVAGASTGRTKNNNNVAGVSDNNFRVPVRAYIEGEDFCRAVRRCLINDLVAAAQDENDNDRDHCRKRRN